MAETTSIPTERIVLLAVGMSTLAQQLENDILEYTYNKPIVDSEEVVNDLKSLLTTLVSIQKQWTNKR